MAENPNLGVDLYNLWTAGKDNYPSVAYQYTEALRSIDATEPGLAYAFRRPEVFGGGACGPVYQPWRDLRDGLAAVLGETRPISWASPTCCAWRYGPIRRPMTRRPPPSARCWASAASPCRSCSTDSGSGHEFRPADAARSRYSNHRDRQGDGAARRAPSVEARRPAVHSASRRGCRASEDFR